MRIISQDGRIDMPYDGICLEICGFKNADILARHPHITSNAEIICMANYSTEEKAMKAMEMLHRAYSGEPLYVNTESFDKDIYEKLAHLPQSPLIVDAKNKGIDVTHIGNIVWRFPQEDEIE